MPKSYEEYPRTTPTKDDIAHVISNLDIIWSWMTDEDDDRDISYVIENICNSQFQYRLYDRFVQTIMAGLDDAIHANDELIAELQRMDETLTRIQQFEEIMKTGGFVILVDTGDDIG